MDDKDKKGMTKEEAEQVFKEAVFEAFSSRIPGVYKDEDRFIVVPTIIRKRKPSGDSGSDMQK